MGGGSKTTPACGPDSSVGGVKDAAADDLKDRALKRGSFTNVIVSKR